MHVDQTKSCVGKLGYELSLSFDQFMFKFWQRHRANVLCVCVEIPTMHVDLTKSSIGGFGYETLLSFVAFIKP
jgi:hypothetical protein